MSGLATVFAGALFVLGMIHPPIRYTFYPVHVMTAWTEREGEISVRWSSGLPVFHSTLRYRATHCSDRPSDLTWTEEVPQWQTFFKYKFLLWEVLYTAVMTGLQDSCDYEYVVGGLHFPSRTYRISGRTPYYDPDDELAAARPASLLVYGDMGRGQYSQATRTHIKKYMKEHEVAAIIHLGDVAYDLDDSGGMVGDEYLAEMEGIIDSVPYLLIPGNHETAHNFTHFRSRFRMPVTETNEGSNFFYSFNLGPAHFSLYSTEVYSYCSKEAAQTQFNWLRDDLTAASASAWVVVLGHKPLYCNIDWTRSMESVKGFRSNYNCGPQSAQLRDKVEDLLNEKKVDLYLAGHVHRYEREAAVFRNTTVLSDYDSEHVHVNPRAPVHIISGIAGSDHLKNPISSTPQLWNRFEANDFGFGVLTVMNKTHLYWEQFSSETEEVIDFVWLVKEA